MSLLIFQYSGSLFIPAVFYILFVATKLYGMGEPYSMLLEAKSQNLLSESRSCRQHAYATPLPEGRVT